MAAAWEGLSWAVGAVNDGRLRRNRALTDTMVRAARVEVARDLAGWGTRAFLMLDPLAETPERLAFLGPAVAVFDRFQKG